MRLGIKLDLGFDHRPEHRELYGTRDICGFLRERGIAAVESPIEPGVDEAAVADHVRRCANAGLQMSSHPYTEGTEFNPADFADDDANPCRRMHEQFLHLAASAAERQPGGTVVNIHSAAAPRHRERNHLVKRSVAFFRWTARWSQKHAPDVRAVAELQITDGTGRMHRIGDAYDELLHVSQAAGVGICWDIGHAFMNATRFDYPLDPPPGFLPRVAHVHCHDVGEEDHEPLVHGKVPWRRQLSDLAAAGFDGTIILEVTPKRLLPAGGSAALERSLDALCEWRDACPAIQDKA